MKQKIIESNLALTFFQILPSQYMENKKTREIELVWHDVWKTDAVKYFCKLIRESPAVYFQKSLTVQDSEINFGDLYIEAVNGKLVQISEELMRKKMAVSVSVHNFRSYYNRSLTAVMDRWANNERANSISFKADSIILSDIAATDDSEVSSSSRWLQQNLSSQQVEGESQRNVQTSIEKVIGWREKNEGIQPDLVVDHHGNLPNAEADNLSLSSLNLGAESGRESGASSSSGRPKPIVQQFREVPFQVADESQSSLVRNGSYYERSSRLILGPAGPSMSTNSRSQSGDENLEQITKSFEESLKASADEVIVGSVPEPDSKRSPLSKAEDSDTSLDLTFDTFAKRKKSPAPKKDSNSNLRSCVNM